MKRISKRGILILLTGVIGIVSLITGISFAVFSFSFEGTKQQAINVGCLKIEMSDNGNLSLPNSFPIKDSDGLNQEAYIYTIENTCSLDAYYETTINVMDGSNIANASKVKVALSGDSKVGPIIESKLPAGTLLENEADVIKTYKLDDGYLKVGQTKTFELRTWIDYDVEQITGSLENKIIINSITNDNKTIAYYNNTSGYNAAKGSKVLKNVNYKQAVERSGVVKNETTTGVVYNFRGNPKNNIQFGSYNSSLNGHASGDPISWKILSTNEDGSINIITTEAVATASYTNSTNRLTTFYNTHLSDEEDYIKTTSTFCKEEATNGTYLAKLRTENNNPTAVCNGTTVTKIGLPTVDDLMFAGEAYQQTRSTYLSSSTAYMTNSKAASSTIYRLTSTGINTVSTGTSTGIRAVITLSKDVILGGLGTEDNPFYVTGLYTDTEAPIADTVKPTIIYARVDEDWSNQNKTVEISAKDNTKIAAYIVKTTNTTPSANDSSWEASTSDKYVTLSSYDNGTYYVFVKDTAGNISDPTTLVVERVDKVAPTCTINIISDPDRMDVKTLSIESTDTNIDLKGYSWEDDIDITTSTRKITQRGTYTAYLKDLAGNQGSCDVTVTGFSDEFEVTVLVNNGTTSETRKTVLPNANATFNLTTTQASPYHTITECTNNQDGVVSNNVLTVSNVTHDTECTVSYRDAGSTVLYTDGTLIINEKASDRNANIALHGTITNEYTPFSNGNNYVFSGAASQPWKNQKSSIKRVEIGQKIQPTNTTYWFYGLTNMTYGNFTNLDTSNVTLMSSMFYQVGYNSTVSSLTLIGLDNWNTSNVLNMNSMFQEAGYLATTVNIGDLSNWDTSKVINMAYMFYRVGYSATSFSSMGTIDIHATDVSYMFYDSKSMKITLNLYNEPSNYEGMFRYAASSVDSLIVVNYYCENAVIDNIIATNVSYRIVKGIEFGCSVEDEFPVTLDAQDGTIPSSTGWTRVADNQLAVKPYTTGSTYGTLPTPTYRNYEFLGWYTRPEGGTQVTSSTTITGTSGHTLYAHWNIPNWTVNVTAVGASITGDASKTVKDRTSPTFNLSTELSAYIQSVSCTNNQKGTIAGNVLTVSNVTNNTTCTVTYSDAGSTVLYTDGTLIINEKSSDRDANITSHGAVTNEYAPMSNSNTYVFNSYSNVLWYSQRANITRVEIGQPISPTNTKYWFYGLTKLTEGDFTNLDTSQVTSMYSMFYQAGYNSSVTSFTLTGLNNWNTSNVTDISSMFQQAGRYATTWNIGNLSNWDVSKVTTMSSMFYQAGYNATTWSIGDLSNWDVSNVKSMNLTFYYAGYNATAFDIGDLSNWDTSKVTSMNSMFSSAGRNTTSWNIGDLSNWDVSNVISINQMFYNAGHETTTFDIGNLSNWDTGKVTDMGYMFTNSGYNATTFDIGNLSNWDTGNVINMNSMFSGAGYNATTFDIGNLSNWDTGNVINMTYMFSNAGHNATSWNIGDLSNWDTGKVIDMSYMFFNAGYNATMWNSIGTLNVYADNINNIFNAVRNAKATLNIYSNPNSYSAAFQTAATQGDALITVNYGCAANDVIDSIVATKSSNSNVVKGSNLNGTCSTYTVNVVVNNGTVDTASKTVSNTSSTTFNLTTTLTDNYVSSVSCTNNQKGTITNNVLTVSNVTNNTTCTVTYSDAGSTVLYTDGTLIINEKSSDRSANITAHGAVTNEYAAFSNSNTYAFSGTTSQPWNSQKSSITRVEIGQPISPTSTKNWFYGLTYMTYGDFTNLDTSNVTTMYQMFENTGSNSSVTSYTLIGLNNWDTSKVTDMYYMFSQTGRYATTWSIGNLSTWNTSQVTNMSYMFYYAGYTASTSMTSIGTLDIYATNIQNMFCYSRYMKATLNIYSSPTSYTSALNYAATQSGALITVNYGCNNEAIADAIIATKSASSNVVKGSEVGCPTSGNYIVTADARGGEFTSAPGWSGIGYTGNSISTTVSMAVGNDVQYCCQSTMPELDSVTGKYHVSGTVVTGITNLNGKYCVPGNWVSNTTEAPTAKYLPNLSKDKNNSIQKLTGCSTNTGYVYNPRACLNSPCSMTRYEAETGGTGYTKTVTAGSPYGTLPSVTKNNSTFTGWYTSISGGDEITSSTIVKKARNHKIYAHYDNTVNLVVINGVIEGESSQTVSMNKTARFKITPNEDDVISSISCTNNQTGKVSKNNVIVSGVTANTTCTLMYSKAGSTVLYTDGTLIINEKEEDRAANITAHGAVTNEYTPMSDSNAYVFNSATQQPWYAQRSSIKFIDIGQRISPTSTAYWFSNSWKLETGDFTNLDTSQVTNMSYMFNETAESNTATSYVLTGLSTWNTSKVTNMNHMFASEDESPAIWDIGDISGWNVSNVKDMSYMFSLTAYNVTSFNLDLSDWDVSNVTDMRSMFADFAVDATNWSVGDLSNWNTSSVENMSYMFSHAGLDSTTFDIGDLSNWDVSQVTTMTGMFYYAGEAATTWDIGDLSSWDTSQVTDMLYMFSYAGYNATIWNSIGTLDIYATNIQQMFNGLKNAKATLNIYSNPTTYTNAFNNAATDSNALITVNYGCNTSNIDSIIATKSSTSNVVKGSGYGCGSFTVNAAVTDGTITGSTSASVSPGGKATFSITPNGYSYLASVSCTNGQRGTYQDGVLTVYSVNSSTTCTVNFNRSELTLGYTGSSQVFYAPAEGYYYIETAGASGGDVSSGHTGGYGAKSSGYIHLNENEKLYVYVGGQGTSGTAGTIATYPGGYNGGANGYVSRSGYSQANASGGGATDIRLVGGTWDNMPSLRSRIMVAGGGGGAYSEYVSASDSAKIYGGNGGTLYGESAVYESYSGYSGLNPSGGTQIIGGQSLDNWTSTSYSSTYAGSFGKGATGGNSYSGGGGGYYGGASGVWQPGAGGSSYISGYAGTNSISSAETITHTGEVKHYSGKYFIGAEMIAGQNKGNGYAKIKYIGAKPVRKDTQLNNVRYIKDCISYNTANEANHWTEIQAIKDGVNIAKGKTVTGTVAEANDTTRSYTKIVDGLIDATGSAEFGYGTTQSENQCVTIDLENTYNLDEVALWNWFNSSRRYLSNNFYVSSDNSTWTNLSQDEVWLETSNGARYNAYIDHINGYSGRGYMTWWLDGFSNTGSGRSLTATSWKNLAGGVATNYAMNMNGTASGATWSNNYLLLDGTDDWVKVGTTNYAKPTIEAVISPTKTHTGESEIAANWETGGYGIYLANNNILTSSYYISSGYRPLADTNSIAVNSIVNVATSYDQTTRKLYKNGELLRSNASYTGAIGTPASSTIMAIGANPSGSSATGNYLGAKIYSFRMYSGVLTDAQIQRNYLYDKQLFHLP